MYNYQLCWHIVLEGKAIISNYYFNMLNISFLNVPATDTTCTISSGSLVPGLVKIFSSYILCNVKKNWKIGCCRRFGRGASLYRHRLQPFGRLWVRLPLLTGSLLRFNYRPIMYSVVGSLVLSWSWTRQPGSFPSNAFGFNCVITLAKVYVRTICLS